MFETILDAKNYYENSGRVDMKKPANFSETKLIEDLYRHADTEDQAEAILAKHIPD